MVHKLLTNNQSCLTSVCKPVKPKDDLSSLISDMWGVIRDSEQGAGLAANQVGALLRVIIVDVQVVRMTVLNPKITKRSEELVRSEEGCLSHPGKIQYKKRNKRITLEGFDANWEPVKRKLKGLPAIVVQHEIDHLNGKTFGGVK